VFYFHRMTKRGIYYILFKEFEKELSQPYSILPLVRPTRSNSASVLDSEAKLREKAAAMNEVGKSLLQRHADGFSEGVEAISRQGCDRSTVDSSGAKVLGAPDTSAADAALAIMLNTGRDYTKGTKRKRKGDSSAAAGILIGDCSTFTQLLDFTKSELLSFARDNDVRVSSCANKTFIANAIIEARAIEAVAIPAAI